MPSPWSCLRSWHPVLYLQVTSVPHLKSPPHPKTPQLPPQKWDPKQPHGPRVRNRLYQLIGKTGYRQ